MRPAVAVAAPSAFTTIAKHWLNRRLNAKKYTHTHTYTVCVYAREDSREHIKIWKRFRWLKNFSVTDFVLFKRFKHENLSRYCPWKWREHCGIFFCFVWRVGICSTYYIVYKIVTVITAPIEEIWLELIHRKKYGFFFLQKTDQCGQMKNLSKKYRFTNYWRFFRLIHIFVNEYGFPYKRCSFNVILCHIQNCTKQMHCFSPALNIFPVFSIVTFSVVRIVVFSSCFDMRPQLYIFGCMHWLRFWLYVDELISFLYSNGNLIERNDDFQKKTVPFFIFIHSAYLARHHHHHRQRRQRRRQMSNIRRIIK